MTAAPVPDPRRSAHECTVQVFAKAPVAGAVKTRLIPALGARGAARLQARLTRFTLERVAAATSGPIELWCAPDAHHPFFARCRREYPLTLHTQPNGDLGTRMHHALACTLSAGAERVLLVGTDCPARGPGDLYAACAALRTGAQIVLGPVDDGGYTLIGIRQSVPEVFAGIPWGTDEVLACTRRRLAERGLRAVELPLTWDVDRAADLERLAAQPQLRGLLEGLGSRAPHSEAPRGQTRRKP